MYRPTYHEPHNDLDWDDVAATTHDEDEAPAAHQLTEEGIPLRTDADREIVETTDKHQEWATLMQAEPPVMRSHAIANDRLIADYMRPDTRDARPVQAITPLPSMPGPTLPMPPSVVPEIIILPDRREPAPEAYVELPIGKEPFENLSGTAGTGKTWTAKKLAKQSPKGSIIVAATTGIAAVNLADEDVETTTINSALKYFNTEDLREKYQTGQLQGILRKHRRSGVRRILIDEKSMMNGHQLTYIARAVDEVNKPRDKSLEATGTGDEWGDEPEEQQPQIGITLVGDFGQLPPVPDEDPRTGRKQPVFFCFDSPEWPRFAAHTTTLTKIWRQDDQAFVKALHAVRKAEIVPALQFFTPDKFSFPTDDNFDGTTIFATNAEVDRYNLMRLDKLQTRTHSFETVRKGQQRPDWKNIPNVLSIKEGALIMLLSNHRIYESEEDSVGKIVYANGDLGYVRGPSEHSSGWIVTLQRTGADVDVCPITRENTIPLEPGRKAELRLQAARDLGAASPDDCTPWDLKMSLAKYITEDGKKEIIGTVFYMPMRLAYGCTVHKTQGLTLDRVQVNISAPFFKQPGMLFVALSRARTIEGLRIVGSQTGFVERCRIEPRVLPWL